MKIHFITFANTDSNFSQDRIIFEAKEMDIFDNITFYTEKDFDEEFLSRCGENIKKYRRGYGYWSWKPYIIKKEFEKMDNGDVVVYADSGCMFLYQNRNELKRWIDIASKSESGILSPCFGPYIEHDWTRGDLYKYIDDAYNHDNVDIFDKAIQCGCGISLYTKKDKCIEFVNNWYDVMTNHFHLCTDEPSSLPNHPNFRENRHDQSVFSMLSKIYGIETINTADGILNKNTSPIIASRCKNDKNTWKKPVKILFDSQIYDLQKFGGISRMYVDLHNELDKNEIYDRYTGSGVASGNYPEFVSRFSVENTENMYLNNTKPYGKGSSDNRKLSIEMLEKGDYDIFYPTFFSTYFLGHLHDKPFVMSVHDMIPELYPQYFSSNDMQIVGKREMVKHASAIEVPTETTKRDLIKILGVDESKVFVVGRGISDDFGKEALDENIVNHRYVLYVGQRNAYKRFNWFIKHASEFFNKHIDIKLVCTGNEFSDNEKELLEKYNMLDKTISIKVNDVELATLYKYAEFFVYTSEYEGFGLPILEAYKMGCIALLNDNDCFKEVTFGKGTFFNLKEDKSDICDVMEETISLTEREKENRLNKQYEILKNYSLQKTASKFKDMFNYVLNNNNAYKNNLDIFICTHKEFKPPVKSNIYKIVNASKINNDTAENGLKGSFYSEIMSYKYVNDNAQLKKYIGFCSYRKYFSFMDDIPDMDKIFSECDAIIGKPIIYHTRTIKQDYAKCHNVEDLYIVGGIIADKYPSYCNSWHNFIDGHIFIPYNMFIMKSEDFKEYIKFVFDILDEYVKIVGIDIEKRIENNKEQYLKNFYPNNTIEYQYRIGGYLAERLTNLFVIAHFKKLKAYPIKITEKKYMKN